MTTATSLPVTTKRPGVYFEVNLSQAPRSPLGTWNCVIVAPGNQTQFQGTSEATANVLYELYSPSTAIALAGSGSFAHLMRQAAYEGDKNVRWFYIKASDNGAAAQASNSTSIIQLTGSAGESKTMNWRLGDAVIPVSVTKDDNVDTIGTAIETAINDHLLSPVTASWVFTNTVVCSTPALNSGSILLTSKMAGTPANSIEWYNEDSVDSLTIVNASGTLANGSGAPDWDAAYDVLEASSTKFKYIVPACATLSELNSGTGNLRDRIGADALAGVGKRMQVVLGNKGTQAAAATFADGLDTGTTDADEPGWRFQTVWFANGVATEPEVAARWCSVRVGKETNDPNVNLGGFHGIRIPYMVPPSALLGGPTDAEIEAALNAGCSPIRYDHVANACYMVLSITCKDTTGGSADYRAMTTNKITVCDYIADDLTDALSDQYDGFRIADDDADGAPPVDLAANTTTPSLIGDFVYLRGKESYVADGLIEDFERSDVEFDRNTINTKRADGFINTKVIPWFLQLAAEVNEVTP